MRMSPCTTQPCPTRSQFTGWKWSSAAGMARCLWTNTLAFAHPAGLLTYWAWHQDLRDRMRVRAVFELSLVQCRKKIQGNGMAFSSTPAAFHRSLQHFWTRFHQWHPLHPIFGNDLGPAVNLDSTIPIMIYGDEGRGTRTRKSCRLGRVGCFFLCGRLTSRL